MARALRTKQSRRTWNIRRRLCEKAVLLIQLAVMRVALHISSATFTTASVL